MSRQTRVAWTLSHSALPWASCTLGRLFATGIVGELSPAPEQEAVTHSRN
jgi:hypothetical protein